MEVKKCNLLNEIFSEFKQFSIPAYQRNYDWNHENCKLLYEDIINLTKGGSIEKNHFMGSIVLYNANEQDEIGIKYQIIDGQQRITTIFLMLKALHDLSENEKEKQSIKKFLFNYENDYELDEGIWKKIKLRPVETDEKTLIDLMTDNLSDFNESSSNIKKNYVFLKNEISKLNKKEIEKILLAMKEKLTVVVIYLNKKDNPQEIFERINSTGEELMVSDLLRNFVLMTETEKNGKLYFKNYWKPVEKEMDKKDLNDFVLTYLFFKLPEWFNQKRIYHAFKEYAYNNEINNVEILKELKKYSSYYKSFIELKGGYLDDEDVLNKKSLKKSELIKTKKLLKAFKDLNQTTIYPLLFNIFDDFDENHINLNTLEKVLHFFVTYITRRAVCSVSTSGLRKFFKSLYKRFFENEKMKNEEYLNQIYKTMASINNENKVPNDDYFRKDLEESEIYNKRNLCRYLLTKLQDRTFVPKEEVKMKTITIEHIMPQNIENNIWMEEIGDDYVEVHKKYLHRIGNLTLTGFNAELSNKPFKNKKEKYNESTVFSKLNEDILSCERWNKESIEKRSNKLISILFTDNLFKLPQRFLDYEKENKYKPTNEILDINLNSEISLTNTKPIYFKFLNKEVNVLAYRELIKELMSILYNENPKLMNQLAENNYSIPNSKVIQISYDKTNFKGPIILENNRKIFINGNRNSNSVLPFLRPLLKEFNLEDSNLIIRIIKTKK